jgi:hypothetical protein
VLKQAEAAVVSITLHSFLNFQLHSPERAQFQAFNGQIYGIELLPNQQPLVQLATEGMLSYDPYLVFENQMGCTKTTIHFMGMMLRRKHQKATRRVASFGLGFGSKHKVLENFKQIMLKYLNLIFDAPHDEPDRLEKMIQELYQIVNQKHIARMLPERANFLQRAVSADFGFNVVGLDQKMIYPVAYMREPAKQKPMLGVA